MHIQKNHSAPILVILNNKKNLHTNMLEQRIIKYHPYKFDDFIIQCLENEQYKKMVLIIMDDFEDRNWADSQWFKKIFKTGRHFTRYNLYPYG
jgi:hypothetical protein